MALAKYFSKDLLAINKLIKTDGDELKKILDRQTVALAFDQNASSTLEGKAALDLLVRITCRLYPRIAIIDLASPRSETKEKLVALAKRLNSEIEIVEDTASATVSIVCGHTLRDGTLSGEKIFIGSSNWIATYSRVRPQEFANSSNPLGAGIAACLASANLFRIVFADLLKNKPCDEELTFSVLSGKLADDYNPAVKNFEIKQTTLVGGGAIGNGFLWALSHMNSISGELTVVEPQSVSLSNLQRYVLLEESDEGKDKTESYQKLFTDAVRPIFFKGTWAEFLGNENQKSIETVAVAIDNKKDRMAIQSSLPKRILNAYTEENLVGLARHIDFVESACMACGYIPFQKEVNYTEQVGQQLRVDPNIVKDYLNLNIPVDARYNFNTVSLLDMVSSANGIDRQALSQFQGKRVNEFYSDFVCGGLSLSLASNSHNGDVAFHTIDAPLAFQSAMAGILLAAEVLIQNSNLRKEPLSQQSHFYPLNVLSKINPHHHTLAKDSSGRCLCSDADFITVYKERWK